MEEPITDFNGRVIRVGSWCEDCPYLCLSNTSNKPKCVGLYMDMLQIVATKLNFSFVWQIQPFDNLWGSFVNNNWTGMFHEVMYRDKDFTINRNFITIDRVRDFDYSEPLNYDQYGLIAMEPAPLPPWTRLVVPFSSNVWGSFIFFTLMVIIGVTLLTKDKDYIQVIQIVTGQGSTLGTISTARKWWLGCWITSSFFILSVYVAKLSSVLSVDIPASRIETLEEFAESNTRCTILDQGTFIQRAIENEELSTAKYIVPKLDLTPEENGHATALKLLKARSHYFIASYSYMLSIKKTFNLVESYFVKEEVYSGSYVWYFKKKSWMRKPINRVLVRLKETGIFQRHFNQHFQVREISRKANVDKTRNPFSLHEMQGAFIILAIGLSVAIAIFLMECYAGLTKNK